MATTVSVLIVEDHDRLREILVQHLRQQGFYTKGAADAEGMHERMSQDSFDVVVLDLNLPDEDGLSIARRLRSVSPELFIIMMTARNRPTDKVMGYQSGADVFISKPSSGDELLAAIKSWRRRQGLQPVSRVSWRLDLIRRELQGDQIIMLSSTESDILLGLCQAPGLQLDYSTLMQCIGQSMDSKGKASLEVYMARLRKKLVQGGFPSPAIKSNRNRGYQLIQSIEIVSA